MLGQARSVVAGRGVRRTGAGGCQQRLGGGRRTGPMSYGQVAPAAVSGVWIMRVVGSGVRCLGGGQAGEGTGGGVWGAGPATGGGIRGQPCRAWPASQRWPG
jgi:hypothetical protein